MTLRALLVGLVVLAATVVGGAAASEDRADFEVITLRHKPTGLVIRAPEGFKLEFRSGLYILRKGVTSISFARLATNATPFQIGGALEQALGGRVVVRAGDARHRVGQIVNGRRGDTFVVERIGPRLAVTTSTSLRGRPVVLQTLRQIGLGAKGGVALRAPKAKAQPAMPLRPYRAPDGGATALVPSGNDWVIQSSGGTVEGSSVRGAFLFGFSYNVPLTVPPGSPPSFFALPYLNAVTALGSVFPRLSPSWKSFRVRRVLKDAILPSFTSSGMLQFDFRINGRPWTGVATVATDHPSKYSNVLWNFYYSGIVVPRGSNPSVGVGLLRSWKSWDPSGAIAARTRAAIALINETNEIWQQTSEFRSRIADQQSRDVGCLLQGYYIVEDNARRYGLPPLGCGQIYTERP